MKRLIALIMVVVLLIPAVALASDISGAKWYSVITVSNNSTEADDIFTTFPLGTQALIDPGFVSANLTDCAMHDTSGIDTAFMPAVNATYPWCLYVNNIGENAFKNYLLYTGGNADMDGKIRYFPGAGGMTSTDNSTIELSNNFTIEQKGWIDTDNGTDKNLVYKEDAIIVFVSPTVSENITCDINPAMGWLTPATSGDGAGWSDLGNIKDDVTGSKATSANIDIGDWTSYVLLTHSSIRCDTIRYWATDAADTDFNIDVDVWYGGGWHNIYTGDLVPGAWVEKVIPAGEQAVTKAQVRFQNKPAEGFDNRACFFHEFDFYQSSPDASVTATGIESGEHTITVSTDNTSLFLGIAKDNVNADFPITDNLTLNAPLWHTELDRSPFTTKDATEHSCTVTNALWGADNGYYFDGAGDEIVHTTLLDGGTDNVTFEIWVKPTGGEDSERWLIRKSNVAGQDRLYLTLHTDNTVRWFAEGNNGGDKIVYSATTTLNNWYHIVATYEVGKTQRLYLNLTETRGLTIVDAIQAGVDTDFTISRAAAGTLTGYIGEVRVYSRALSADEIAQNYNATKWKYEASDEYFHYNLLPAGGVPDNANDWTFVENYSMPYMEYHKIWIDGVLRQHIEYEYDDTVFSDLSGNSQDAYPTFRAASSDADVSVAMASWRPIEEAKAPAWVLGVERDFWDTENITATGTFTTTPTPTAAPGVAVIEAISTASATPSQLPFNVIAGFVILSVSITGSWFLAKYGSRNLWLKITLVTICMAVCVAVKVFDFWMVVFFLIMAIAVALFSRRRSEG